jgi:hypothetical protein
MHLVGIYYMNIHDARSSECQMRYILHRLFNAFTDILRI